MNSKGVWPRLRLPGSAPPGDEIGLLVFRLANGKDQVTFNMVDILGFNRSSNEAMGVGTRHTITAMLTLL